MTEEEKIALFDAYLRKEMSQEELLAFEQQLNDSEQLRTEFEAYQFFSEEIHDGEEYGAIKDKLEEIHQENFGKKKSIFLRPQFLIPMGVAAGIALLFTVMNPGAQSGDTAANENADYHELHYTEEEGEAAEDDMAAEMDTSLEITETDTAVSILDEILPLANKQPNGTCFLISKKGFFITSKHLVRKRRYVKLQQKDQDIAFNAEVIYRDSILDFAILKCSEQQAENFKAVPFKFYKSDPKLGDDVFTLGYPKPDIVYTKGVVSSETGFRSDSMSFQISMPSNPGNSGAPLFTRKGDLVGMVIANSSKKQSVTYILKPDYIQERISSLQSDFDIDMSRNYTKRFSKTSDLISKYRPFIFEIH